LPAVLKPIEKQIHGGLAGQRGGQSDGRQTWLSMKRFTEKSSGSPSRGLDVIIEAVET
jgi:hypothetical protein